MHISIMSNKLLAASFLLLAIASIGCVSQNDTSSEDAACTDSGGTVSSAMCCTSASDYPNSCLIGACGCSPDNSHSVMTCQCPEGQCFDGTRCVGR